jgi:hypothetical protein
MRSDTPRHVHDNKTHNTRYARLFSSESTHMLVLKYCTGRHISDLDLRSHVLGSAYFLHSRLYSSTIYEVIHIVVYRKNRRI